MLKPMDVTPEITWALAYLRTHAKVDASESCKRAVDALDEAGVFAEIDEHNDYASAEEILAEAALDGAVKARQADIAADVRTGHPVDPAEWGDTTRADMARHAGVDPSDVNWDATQKGPAQTPVRWKTAEPGTAEHAHLVQRDLDRRLGEDGDQARWTPGTADRVHRPTIVRPAGSEFEDVYRMNPDD